jgi:hypothetical protein
MTYLPNAGFVFKKMFSERLDGAETRSAGARSAPAIMAYEPLFKGATIVYIFENAGQSLVEFVSSRLPMLEGIMRAVETPKEV